MAYISQASGPQASGPQASGPQASGPQSSEREQGSDTEHELRLQFLEEAQDYLDTIEGFLMGLSDGPIDPAQADAAMRAAHSIKGGSALMGFRMLSSLAHHLEEFLKILKARRQTIQVDAPLEQLLLAALDQLRQVSDRQRAGEPLNAETLKPQVQKIFGNLRHRLGKLQPEDENALLSEASGTDVAATLFEQEVGGLLDELAEKIQQGDPSLIREALAELTQDLTELGIMLKLDGFVRLCEVVAQQQQNQPEQVSAIAPAALDAWRKAHAMVLVGQAEQISHRLPGFTDGATLPSSPRPESPGAELPGPELPGPELPGPELPGPESPSSTPIPTASPPNVKEKSVRVPLRLLEQLSDLFGELLIERNALNLRLDRLQTMAEVLRDRIQETELSNEELRRFYDQIATETATTGLGRSLSLAGELSRSEYRRSPSQPLGTTATLDQNFDILEKDRYSNLHLLSQDQMENVVRLQEVSTDIDLGLAEARQAARKLNQTIKQLQNRVTQSRMRPLSELVSRFPRTIRELSLKHGKQVQLEVQGGTTLVDRAIVEALADPLLHLLRNAFDHGIEPPEIRRAAGKSETGRIQIRAAHRGRQTLIQIQDDGAGINLEKIRDRARQMGISDAQLARSSEADLLDLIFEPGFSTADQVTDLSGRGVGMDVVRTNLRQIRGDVKVETRPGQGTTFTLAVPLTLSVVRVLLVESNDLLMAMPTDVIAEMILPHPEMLLHSAGQTMLHWNDLMVPVLNLRDWLPFNCPKRALESELATKINTPTILLIHRDNSWVGIQVDRFRAEQEIALRPIEGPLALPPGCSGSTILGNGRVVPIMDPIQLLGWMTGSHTSREPSIMSSSGPFQSLSTAPSTPTSVTQPTPINQGASVVMVVDDSINVRRFLALTLEKAGYRVIQARDGQDAVEKLSQGLSIQAMICDLEMPRLDGYGVLTHVREQSQFRQLPVIMLTSRSSDKHRQLAMTLGATDYFSKPYNEQALLKRLQSALEATAR